MNRKDIVRIVSEKTNRNNLEVAKTMEAIIDTIKGAIISGESVYLRGFGTFNNTLLAEKKARVITENRQIIIPPRFKATFKASKNFTNEMNS